jgi:hypothetical protein
MWFFSFHNHLCFCTLLQATFNNLTMLLWHLSNKTPAPLIFVCLFWEVILQQLFYVQVVSEPATVYGKFLIERKYSMNDLYSLSFTVLSFLLRTFLYASSLTFKTMFIKSRKCGYFPDLSCWNGRISGIKIKLKTKIIRIRDLKMQIFFDFSIHNHKVSYISRKQWIPRCVSQR